MFGNFIEAINILQKKLDQNKDAPLSERLVIMNCIRVLEEALDRYEEDYDRWCSAQAIGDLNEQDHDILGF